MPINSYPSVYDLPLFDRLFNGIEKEGTKSFFKKTQI